MVTGVARDSLQPIPRGLRASACDTLAVTSTMSLFACSPADVTLGPVRELIGQDLPESLTLEYMGEVQPQPREVCGGDGEHPDQLPAKSSFLRSAR